MVYWALQVDADAETITSSRGRGSNPVWGDEFTCDVPHLDSMIEIALFDGIGEAPIAAVTLTSFSL